MSSSSSSYKMITWYLSCAKSTHPFPPHHMNFPPPFTSLYLSPFPHFQTIPPQYSTLLSSFTISFFSLSESLSLSLNFRLPLHSASNQAFSERNMWYQAQLSSWEWGCVWVEILSVEVEAFSVYCACADIEVVSVFLLWLRLSWYCEAQCWVWVCLCLIRGALKVDIGIVSVV